MKAYIKKDGINSDALWLIVQRGDEYADIKGILGMFREEDTAGNVAYPVMEAELKAIRDAINEYLDK